MEVIIALIVGLVLILTAIFSIQTKKALNNKGIKTEGVVFDIIDSQSLSLKFKIPVIRFLDLNKKWITEEAKLGTAIFQYKVGDKVIVAYEKENPKNFVIQDAKSNTIIYILLIAGILIFFIAALSLVGIKF
jgi:hypothetical protein